MKQELFHVKQEPSDVKRGLFLPCGFAALFAERLRDYPSNGMWFVRELRFSVSLSKDCRRYAVSRGGCQKAVGIAADLVGSLRKSRAFPQIGGRSPGSAPVPF